MSKVIKLQAEPVLHEPGHPPEPEGEHLPLPEGGTKTFCSASSTLEDTEHRYGEESLLQSSPSDLGVGGWFRVRERETGTGWGDRHGAEEERERHEEGKSIFKC